jgi:ABC-type antimicrobial peptide transport system permease subunit
MLRTYLKIAWRNIRRNGTHSVLNIMGLATGMAVVLLIGLWIYNEYSYDRFLPGYSQLYKVKLNFDYNGDIKTQSGASLPMADALRKDFPEIKYVAETNWPAQHSLVAGDKKLYRWGMTVGEDFLKMFQYPLLTGNAATVLKDPFSIVLTQFTAKALFGNEDPINKMIRIDNRNDVKVVGVLKDIPENSTIQFSYLLPFSYAEQTEKSTKRSRTEWTNYSYPQYIQLQPGVTYAQIAPKIKDIVKAHDPNAKIELILHPMEQWRLYAYFKNGKVEGGLIEYVRMFGNIGLLVLIIACINFTNLSTARSEKRAREVGVRKAIGSRRRDLILQFLAESFATTTIAALLSLAIVIISLPYFNTLTGGSITLPYNSFSFWCIMIGYVLVTGLLAGSRPAFYLSSFKPVKVLKGSLKEGKAAALPRKVLVVLQFSCSIALIISTIIIYQQLQHVRDRPTGYNANRLMMTNGSPDLNRNYASLKNDLLQTGVVESVTKASSPVTDFTASFKVTAWPGKMADESMEMPTTSVSEDYFSTLGMTIKQGRDFSGAAGDSISLIVNEAAVKKFRLKDPLNQLITFDYSKTPMRIIGVVKDAVITSPFGEIDPALFIYNPYWAGNIMYRLKKESNTQQAIAKLTAVFNKYNPAYPYGYRFADEVYDSKFKMEQLVGSLAGIFATLAIFISCLGLFGLVAYVAERRTREIGIRKVLGASVSRIWLLLSGEFILLVTISSVIASPIALYFLNDWLQKYTYRISIGPGVFIVSALMALVITIATISFRAVKTALMNPVKSLRTE